MNILSPTPEDIELMLKDMQKMHDQRNDALRKIFGKFIKQNFLIRIKEEIKSSFEFRSIMSQCYNLGVSPILALGVDDIDFDICSNLAMINWYLMLPHNKEFKSKQYKDENYITELKKRTINQCQLRQLIQNYEEKNFLLTHSPINFSMHCVVNFLLEHVNENIKKKQRANIPNANFKINTILVMLKTIRSILLLTEYDDCGNAFSLLRALIETIFVYLAIYDNEIVANEYYRFMNFREIFEITGQYPEEFEQIVPSNCPNKQNYLNYGWLDTLEKKSHKYIFSEVVACSVKTNKEYNNSFLKAYKYCCKYVHGNYINQKIPSYSFIWILGKAGEILINISRQFSYIFSEETDYNGINLEKYLIKHVEEAIAIYAKIQTSNE